MELKIFNISNIFDENDNINYFKYLLITITNPKYISNITYWLIIFSILFDNKMLMHSLLPLCITNAIIISIAALMKKSFKYSNNDKQFKNKKQLESINKLYNKNIYLYKF